MFSEWSSFAADGPAIVKAQFNVFVGRTAREVVQAQSVLYPWGIKVVRTIVMDRRSGGGVLRMDSAGQAATPGLFRFPLLTLLQTPGLIHAGPIDGVFNVRRIRDNGSLITIDGVSYAPVLFDGDFRLDPRNPIVAGGFGGGFTVSHDIDGYLQLGRFHAEPLPHGAPGQTINVATPVTRAQLGTLLRQRGPIAWDPCRARSTSVPQVSE